MKGAGIALHAPLHPGHAAARDAPFTIDVYALGAFACCVALLVWWAWMQCASRCADCGYCPVWCACEHA
jgi:hypothetical protein